MTFTVTATAAGSVDNGISCQVAVLTGQAGSPIGVHPSATSATPSLATGTGVTTGSLVYGALLGILGTASANAATTVQHDTAGNGLEYIQLRSTLAMVGGVSATLGVTGITGISISLLEILTGGSLTEASVTTAATTSVHTVTTAAVTAATGSILVVPVTANGAGGVVTMGITDSSGLSIPWAEYGPQQGAGNGYAGVWAAVVPAPGTPSTGILMGGEI
jgi:hypothetical protein